MLKHFKAILKKTIRMCLTWKHPRLRFVEVSALIMPREKDETDVSWLFKSRKYIQPGDCIRSLAKAYGKPVQVLAPTPKKWEGILENDKNTREFMMTVYSVVPEFNDANVASYLSNQKSRSLGVALSIEMRRLEDVLRYGESLDVCLYLEEYALSDREISLLTDTTTMKDLYDRLLDNKKVMYTRLVSNFYRLLQRCQFPVEEKFIANYISRMLSYNEDTTFIEFLLNRYPTSHPDFTSLDSLSWDPYTKSRRYSHWLEAIRRVERLSNIYSNFVDAENPKHKLNLNYLSLYREFKSEYDICFF